MVSEQFKMPPPGERPAVDPAAPSTFGIHLSYISQEVSKMDDKLDAISNQIASMMQTIPVTYATAGGVQQLASRVDAIERTLDIAAGAAPTQQHLATEVRALHDNMEQIKGGMSWLRAATAIAFATLGALMTALKYWVPNP